MENPSLFRENIYPLHPMEALTFDIILNSVYGRIVSNKFIFTEAKLWIIET